tara:strand:- start:180 stop:1568 length:1389 start_codon:yes stop_codon:yes gene_type:complete
MAEEVTQEKAATGNMLVHGAGQVARAKTKAKSGDLMASKAATKVAKHISDGMKVTIQRRNKEFNDIMKTQLSKEGLTDEEYNEMYKKLKRRRGAYVYLNKKQRMDFERETLEEAEDFKKNEADREEIADIVTDENNEIDPNNIDNDTVEDIVTGKLEPTKDENGRVGYSLNSAALEEFVLEDEEGNPKLASYKEAWGDDRFTVSEDGKTKTDKFGNSYSNDEEGYAEFQRNSKLYWIREARKSGEKVLHIDSQTGKREYLDPDEAEALMKDEKKFVTMDEIKDHVKNSAKDNQTSQNLSTSFMSYGENAKNLKQGDDIKFDFNKAKDHYSKMVNSNKDPIALASQNVVGDTSFKQDLTEKLQTMDYKQLGLSEDMVKKLDPTPGDGKVTQADANSITKKIMQNDKMLKGMLTNYFTLYAAREHKNNVPSNLKQNQQNIPTVTNNDLELGSVNDSGVWVDPNK